MKALSNDIAAFINDYQLESKDGVICFEALLFFSATNTTFKFKTNVQIVTLIGKNMDIVYLLNPEIEKYKIPDMFFVDENMVYMKNLALMFKGFSTIYGMYVVSLHLNEKDCDDETIKELHAKAYN